MKNKTVYLYTSMWCCVLLRYVVIKGD